MTRPITDQLERIELAKSAVVRAARVSAAKHTKTHGEREALRDAIRDLDAALAALGDGHHRPFTGARR